MSDVVEMIWDRSEIGFCRLLA